MDQQPQQLTPEQQKLKDDLVAGLALVWECFTPATASPPQVRVHDLRSAKP